MHLCLIYTSKYTVLYKYLIIEFIPAKLLKLVNAY